jgi:hypothetical protein
MDACYDVSDQKRLRLNVRSGRVKALVVGVSWYPRKSKWMARPSVDGKEAGAYTPPLVCSF